MSLINAKYFQSLFLRIFFLFHCSNCTRYLVQLKTLRNLPFLTEILQYQRKGFITDSTQPLKCSSAKDTTSC